MGATNLRRWARRSNESFVSGNEASLAEERRGSYPGTKVVEPRTLPDPSPGPGRCFFPPGPVVRVGAGMRLPVLPEGMPVTELVPAQLPAVRTATPRHYLMCRPTYFAVEYAINPWMNPGEPVDRDLAIAQWEGLRETYLR